MAGKIGQWWARGKAVKRWLRGRNVDEVPKEEYRSFVAGFDMGFKHGAKYERAMNNKWIWKHRFKESGGKDEEQV